jgi:transposase
MLQITPHMKILVAVAPADFRRGIDGLARLCRESLAHDPFSGAVFVFRNRRGTALKALVYDGQGFWLCHKRLSRGHFPWWPAAAEGNAQRLAALRRGGATQGRAERGEPRCAHGIGGGDRRPRPLFSLLYPSHSSTMPR